MANELSNLSPRPGSRKERTRVGRGEGSGKGKTAGRGTKGAGARSGSSKRHGFEGGQMPLYRRLPKKGFKNPFEKVYSVVNVEALNKVEAGTTVDAEFLKSSGIIAKIEKDGVKLLGRGDLGVALHLRVAKISRTAAEKVLAAGGTVEEPVSGQDA